jgi:hypothetical protein
MLFGAKDTTALEHRDSGRTSANGVKAIEVAQRGRR